MTRLPVPVDATVEVARETPLLPVPVPREVPRMVMSPSAAVTVADLMIETVDAHAPGFKASVVGRLALGPRDLERRFGLVGGDIFHGALSMAMAAPGDAANAQWRDRGRFGGKDGAGGTGRNPWRGRDSCDELSGTN